MERFSTFDLRQKEVISINDGKRLGYPSDFELDLSDGRILSLLIPRYCGFFGWRRAEDLIIPWNKIECIGEDAILVRITEAECIFPEKRRKRIL